MFNSVNGRSAWSLGECISTMRQITMDMWRRLYVHFPVTGWKIIKFKSNQQSNQNVYNFPFFDCSISVKSVQSMCESSSCFGLLPSIRGTLKWSFYLSSLNIKLNIILLYSQAVLPNFAKPLMFYFWYCMTANKQTGKIIISKNLYHVITVSLLYYYSTLFRNGIYFAEYFLESIYGTMGTITTGSPLEGIYIQSHTHFWPHHYDPHSTIYVNQSEHFFIYISLLINQSDAVIIIPIVS